MASKVEPVSARTVYRPAPEGGATSKAFPLTLKTAMAESLPADQVSGGKTDGLSQNVDAQPPVFADALVQAAPKFTVSPHPSGSGLPELATPPPLSSPPRSAVPDLDEMVVDLRYGRMVLSPAIVGYGDDQRILLPLVQVARILDFSISGKQGRINGWFLDEDRILDFNPATGTGTVEGRPVTLTPDQYQVRKDGVYVDAKVLSSWFPVDFSYDFSQQSVSLDPRETLPFQDRMARENMMNQVRQFKPREPQLPLREPEYRFIDPMFVDLGFFGSYKDSKEADKGGKGRYYVLGRGDLGFMNSEIYVTGDEKDRMNTTRITLMREDPRGNLLGPLKATSVSVGDIRTPSFPVIGGGKLERGVAVTNQPLNASSEYDTTFFTGTLGPGWDAQLFRNGVLLNSQRVGPDGRYNFEDVPLYYGSNEFKLKFYGPQGQEREETKRIVVGSGMTPRGQAEYQVSLSQKDGKIYDPLDRPDTMDKETGRFIGRVRYGAGQNLSVQSGLESQTINGERHDYLTAGVQGQASETFLSADAIQDLSGGNALELLGQKKAGPLDLKVKQQFYRDFTQEGETDLANSVKSKTDVSAFGVLKGNDTLPDLPFSLNLGQTQRKNSDEIRAGARIAAGLNNTYINNAVNWRKDTSLFENASQIQGSTDLTSSIGNLRLRGSLDYDLYPESRIRQSLLSGLYNINRELSSELSVTHDAQNDGMMTGTLGLNWNNGKFILSPQVSYDSDHDVTAFLSFSTSFGMDARSGKTKLTAAREADQGAISARVFHDRNNNQVFDEGDTPIEGAEVLADQHHKSAVTDKDGIAFLTGLRQHLQTDISLKTETLEDPFWEPSVPGNSVLPRPGHVDVVDIPVTSTGEIDGVLFLERDGEEKAPLTHAPIQLLDLSGQVIQTVKSEYDGFYLFMKVPPGDYQIRLAPDFAKIMGVAALKPQAVTIGSDGTVVAGHDLVFAPTAKEKPPQTLAAAGTRPSSAPDNTPIFRWEPGTGNLTDHTGPDPVHTAPAPALGRSEPDAAMATEPRTVIPAGTSAPEHRETETKVLATETGTAARFGRHIASYRSPEAALRGIAYHRARMSGQTDTVPVTVQKTDLGAKGIWYRVFAGANASSDRLSNLTPAPRPSYVRLIRRPDGSTGIHMASYRTKAAALKGIDRLRADWPAQLKNQAFDLAAVDLGPGKGVWHRVVATGFDSREAAQTLAASLESRKPDSAPMAPAQGLTVHTASYRTMEKAVAHLKSLARDLGADLPDQVSVRPVDLGKKGIWYRVVLGQFAQAGDAASLVATLKRKGDYARVISLAGS